MISITKKEKDQAKDKEYAMNVQIEELRNGFERIKAENIKLEDNLDTQNKLWKMWIVKSENKDNKLTVKSDNKEVAADIDDEILLAEDDDIHDIQEVSEDDEVERIYQRYLINQQKTFKCKECSFTSNTEEDLGKHIHFKHRSAPKRSHEVHRTESKQLYCHYWNNFGSCQFELKTGRTCKFAHKSAPQCKVDGKCTRKLCMFTHRNQNVAFLANPQTNQQTNNFQQRWTQQPNPWSQPRQF